MPFYSYIKTLSKTPIRGLGEVKHRHAKNVEFSTNLLFAPDKLAQEKRKTPKISVKRLAYMRFPSLEQVTVEFICHYALHWYPFDTQVVFVVIHHL